MLLSENSSVDIAKEVITGTESRSLAAGLVNKLANVASLLYSADKSETYLLAMVLLILNT
jgi:hypothetical protein